MFGCEFPSPEPAANQELLSESLRHVDVYYLNLALWVAGSMLAVGTLMGMMRRRRDQLVEELREHVERARSTDKPADGERKK